MTVAKKKSQVTIRVTGDQHAAWEKLKQEVADHVPEHLRDSITNQSLGLLALLDFLETHQADVAACARHYMCGTEGK